jgi:hypothetical protein
MIYGAYFDESEDVFSGRNLTRGPKFTVPECAMCQKQIGTTNQFVEHLAVDALPELFSRLRASKK